MKLKYKDYAFVSIQFALFFAYLFNVQMVAFSIPKIFSIIALISSFLGAFILILAILQLNTNLSPFPTPKSNATLIKNGLYKYVRHPIYTGILWMLFGNAFYQQSFFKIAITIILLILFYCKTTYEEKRLLKKYSAYTEYKKNTGRFLPKLYV